MRHNLHIFLIELCQKHPGKGDLMSEALEIISQISKKGMLILCLIFVFVGF